MRTHTHESDEQTLRPKSARLDPPTDAKLLEAAATGHSEVLDGPGVLGLQRAVGNAGVGALLEEDRSPVHDVVNSGGGKPLDPDLRQDMESRLGHDFGDVRVHDDSAAHSSAKSVNAHAYTVGSNVVFQRDKYDPGSTEGRTMLAHELTHVVQQRNGPVDGTDAAGGVRVSDPSDRFEREAAATAERAISGPAPLAGGLAETNGPSVQRQEAPADEEEEEPTAQGTFVQRQDAPEEEEEQEPA